MTDCKKKLIHLKENSYDMNRLKTRIKITHGLLLFAATLVVCSSCQLRSKKALVTSKIQKAAKIATQEVVVSKYVMFDAKRNRIPFSAKTTRLIYVEAYVKYGVDLQKILPDDVVINGDILEIKLPAVEELNFSIPLEKMAYIDFDAKKIPRHTNKFPKEIDDELMKAQEEIKRTIKGMALEQSAEERTRKFMTTFLEQLGFGAVIIEFKEKSTQNKVES